MSGDTNTQSAAFRRGLADGAATYFSINSPYPAGSTDDLDYFAGVSAAHLAAERAADLAIRAAKSNRFTGSDQQDRDLAAATRGRS